MPPKEVIEQEHGKRPEWWNGISLGNVITIAGGLIVAAVGWGAVQQKIEAQDALIASNKALIAESELRQSDRVNDLRTDMRRIEDKLDRVLLGGSK